MKNKLLKGCLIVLISTASVLCLREFAHACAWGGFEYDSAGYAMFPQKLIGESPLAPFLFEPSQPYFEGLLDSTGGNQFSGNEEEWVKYFEKEPSEKEVAALVFKSKLKDLEELKKAILKQANGLNDTLLKNKATQFLIRTAGQETINYLIFAKRCEPHASSGQGDWYSLPIRDSIAMEKLSNEGNLIALAAKNRFLRCRYGFQSARMAHYGGRYEQCLKLCEAFDQGADVDSYISRRFQALKAGAMKHLGQFAEARYRFAMMFDKYYAEDFDFYYRNFAFSTPSDWVAGPNNSIASGKKTSPDSLRGYQYCRNGHEKAVLWFLDAYKGTVAELPAMQAMLRYEPGSELLDILLVRTLTEMEKGGYFPKYMYEYPAHPADRVPDGVRDPKAFRDFVLVGISKTKLKRKYLWEYVAGHLSYMMRDYSAAHRYFQISLADAPPGVSMAKQAKAMEILMDVELAKQLDSDFETGELPNLKWMKENYPKDDHLTFLFWRMSRRYEAQGDTIRSVLCRSQSAAGIDLIAKAESHPLEKLIDWMSKPGKSPFEEQLVNGFKYSLEQLHEIQGTVFLRQHRLSEAIAQFRLAGTMTTLPANPFEIHIKDCHDCDFAEKNDIPFTKLTFIQRMMELEALSNESGSEQANSAFEAANGYYNMSYYGNSWMTMAYTRSGYDSTDQFFDCSVAQYFYEKARKLSADPEFQAKCVFMASKCEHNSYQRLWGVFGNTDEKSLQGPRSYDKLLKEQYANTKYYSEVIKECSYFRYYVNH